MVTKSTFDAMDEEYVYRICQNAIDDVYKKEHTGKKLLYFAGPWFTKKAAALNEACKKIYLSCNKSKYDVFFPRDALFEKPEDAFMEDVKRVKECDVLVAMVDDKDVGTAWEIGMAYALGKTIYLLGLDESSFKRRTNLMLAFTGKCFTLSKWHKFLTSELKPGDFVDTEKCWEVLE